MFKKLVGTAMSALLTVSLFAGAVVTANAVTGGAVPDALVKEGLTSVTQPRDGDDAQATSEEMAAYLFVHFIDEENDATKEQIYFSVSQNGTRWKLLNEKKPILTSTKGEEGVRDPHIIRKHDGSGFYLIATDLSIYHLGQTYGGEKWTQSQRNGSKSIVVWESADLVNWDYVGDGLHKIARDNAGCTWAPESIWDDDAQAYMVFWASKTAEDDYSKQRVYRCYTTDFINYSEPEVYIESDVSMIDTTFIKEGDTYYRFTKDENAKFVFMEKSNSLSGDFEAVNTYTLNGKSYKDSEFSGYEGATAYKLIGQDKWCLLLDKSGKYYPYITDDLSTGRFVSSSFSFGGTTYRHGTVIPITQAEYNALMAEYPSMVDPNESAGEGELIYSLDFEDNLEATTGTATATAHGTLTYETSMNGSKAVKISGSGNYVSIEGSLLQGLEQFTISFAVKYGEGKSWAYFIAPNDSAQTYRSEKYIGAVANNGTIESERYNSNKQDRPAAANVSYVQGGWQYVTVVYRSGSTSVYVNGELEARVESVVNIATMLGENPLIQLGKGNWDSGEYSDMLLDSFKIYNYQLSSEQVYALYQSDMGISE